MAEKNNSQGAVDMGFYATSGLKAGQIIDGCASGAIKTLFIAGENPVVSYPNRAAVTAALDKVEFLVVSELFMTETAALADVVLPACSFAEKEGTFTSVDRRVQHIKPAIGKVGQCRTDFEIFGTLIAKLGGQAPAMPATVFGEIAASAPGYAGMSYASLGEAGAFAPVAVKAAFVAPKAAAVEPVTANWPWLPAASCTTTAPCPGSAKAPCMSAPKGTWSSPAAIRKTEDRGKRLAERRLRNRLGQAEGQDHPAHARRRAVLPVPLR